MKTQNLILGLIMFFFVSCGFVYAQPFETIQIGDGTQKFRNPVWSPNGEKLAFWGPGGIYVANADGSDRPTKIFDTFGEDLMWASDSELVYWQRKITKIPQEGRRPKRKSIESVRLVNLNGQEQIIKEGSTVKGPFKLSDGSVGCYRAGEPFEVISYGKFGTDALKKHRGVGLRRRASDNECCEMWLTNADGTFEKRITTKLFYYVPRLSPDGTKILADDFLVLDLDGNELANLSPGTQEISKDIFSIPCCSEWSPNSKQIAYILEIDNDATQMMVGSDVYIINIDGSERTQVTNTPDKIELDPKWSPDGSKIACWADTDHRSGEIWVIKLK